MLDFQEVYGIDLTDEVLEQRSWRWITARAYALLEREPHIMNTPTRLERRVTDARRV